MARAIIAALLLSATLTGCGQKGELYFPEPDEGEREEEREDEG